MEVAVATGWMTGTVVYVPFSDLQESRTLLFGIEQGELAATTRGVALFREAETQGWSLSDSP